MTNETKSFNSAYALMITLVATLGGFLFGFDSGVINGTIDGLQEAFNSKTVGTGFSVASMLLGCAVGAFFAGRISDLFGRRNMLLVSAILFIVSAFGSGIAGSSAEFIVYRIIGGFAVGAASVMAPAYISEIAAPSVRGRLSSIQQIAIITGLTAAFLSNYVLSLYAGSSTDKLWFGAEAWRWMFWVEIIPALIFLVCLFLIPSSPRYLMLKQNEDAALNILEKLQGQENAAKVLGEIRQSLDDEEGSPKFAQLISPQGGIKKIVWVGVGLAVFQQLVGINVIFYYGAVLWQSVGFTEADALLTNVITGGVSILACILAFLLVDRIGRKPLLVIGSIAMAITLTIMAIAFGFGAVGNGGDISSAAGTTALVSAIIYVFFFNLSWGPVMWILLGEMFPNKIRGAGLAVSGFAQWMANFAVTMTFLPLLVTIGLGSAYGVYAFAALVSAVFAAKLVRETRGKTLESMGEL